jgi:nucleotide-binding universal stress UspA family protein
MSDERPASAEPSGGHGAVDEEPLRIPEIDGRIERILVPVDGSAGSERGLAYASLVSNLTGAELVVVVAFDAPLAIRRRGILQTEHLQVEMESDAKELAGEAAELLVALGHRARAVVIRGDAAESILDTADSEHADMIVMGRRGLGRLRGLLVGSVSERVARHATIPVLLAN